MDIIVNCPYRWVLQYLLDIKPAQYASIPTENLMMGILSHKVIEILGKNHSLLVNSEQIEKVYDELVPEMAAELLRPENKVGYLRNKRLIVQAIVELSNMIHRYNLHYAGSELTERKVFEYGIFESRCDLLLQDTDGNNITIDLKWSYSNYAKKLQEGTALQLAAYVWLWDATASAYYILPTRKFITGNASISDEPVDKAKDLKTIWEDSLEVMNTNIINLKNGDISIASRNKDCGYCDYKKLCGMGR